jgi:hypothetical protein
MQLSWHVKRSRRYRSVAKYVVFLLMPVGIPSFSKDWRHRVSRRFVKVIVPLLSKVSDPMQGKGNLFSDNVIRAKS